VPPVYIPYSQGDPASSFGNGDLRHNPNRTKNIHPTRWPHVVVSSKHRAALLRGMEWVRALRGTAAGRRRFRGFCFGGQRRKRNWHTGPSDQRFVRARTGIMGPADSYDPTADARLLRRWLGGRRIWATGPTCQWYESDQRARVASTRHWAERQRRRVGPTVEREKGRGFGPGRGVLAHQVSLLLFFFFYFSHPIFF
jgi:hypothetical protein